MALDKDITDALDIATWDEIDAYILARKSKEAEKLAKEGKAMREKAEALLRKELGYSLSQIFTATSKAPKAVERFNKPQEEGGGIYVYKGKGQMPKWFKTEVDKVAADKIKNDGLDINAAKAAAREAVREKYLVVH